MTAQRQSHQLSRGPLGTQRRWRRPVTELAGLVVGLVLFSWLHNLAGTNWALAAANAQVLQSVERALNLNWEVGANHWLVGHPALMYAAVLYYRLYYLPLAGVLLWVLLRRPDVYPRIKSTLVVMASVALLVFWLMPMSPPRFALAGIIDVVTEHDTFGGGAAHELASGQNLVSAMRACTSDGQRCAPTRRGYRFAVRIRGSRCSSGCSPVSWSLS